VLRLTFCRKIVKEEEARKIFVMTIPQICIPWCILGANACFYGYIVDLLALFGIMMFICDLF